jgi:two-component system, sensor histidine kinase and response regulator
MELLPHISRFNVTRYLRYRNNQAKCLILLRLIICLFLDLRFSTELAGILKRPLHITFVYILPLTLYLLFAVCCVALQKSFWNASWPSFPLLSSSSPCSIRSNRRKVWFCILLDYVFISYFYVLTAMPSGDIFLFYFLPILTSLLLESTRALALSLVCASLFLTATLIAMGFWSYPLVGLRADLGLINLIFNVLLLRIFAFCAIGIPIAIVLQDSFSLLLSKNLYGSLVNNFPQSIFLKDMSGRYVYGNTAFCLQVGLSSDQLIGKTDADLYHPDIAARIAQHDTLVRAGIPKAETEMQVKCPGLQGIMHLYSFPFYNSNERIIGVQGISWEVTKQRKEQEELRKTTHYLKVLLENVPDSIYFKDVDSRFLLVSTSQAARFNARGVDDMIGKTDLEYFAPEHALPARADEQTILLSGSNEAITKVEKEVFKDGRTYYVLTTKMPFRDADNRIVGTFGISRDITELRHYEEMLESENMRLGRSFKGLQADAARSGVRLVRAMRLAKMGSWVWNLPEDSVTPDKEIYSIFGLTPDRKLSKEELESFIVEEDKAEWTAFMQKMEARQIPNEATLRIRTEQRELKWILIRSDFDPDDPQAERVLGFLMDITAQKGYEDALSKIRKELEAAARFESLGLLSGCVAHEVRKNCGTAEGAFSNIIEYLGSDEFNKDQIRENAMCGLDCVSQLKETVSQFLKMGRDSSRDANSEDVPSLLNALLKLMRTEFQRKEVELETAVDPRGRAIYGEAALLWCALANIISNSLYFSSSHQKIRFSSKYVGTPTKEKVLIRICDEGPGFPMEVLAKRCEPFISLKPPGEGTGLGLYATRKCVERLGGSVAMTNRNPQGAKVSILLPLIPQSID